MKPSRMQQRLALSKGQRSTPAKAVSGNAWVNGFNKVAKEFEDAAKPSPALKGKQGGNCNVTACQRPGAFFLNSGTRAYYCLDCAHEIRKFNLRRNSDDGFILYEQWDEDMANYETAMKAAVEARS